MLEARNRGLDQSPEVAQARAGGTSRRAWQTFYEEMVKAKVAVTDADLQALFAKQDYNYHLGWIFLRSTALAKQLVAADPAGRELRAAGGDLLDRRVAASERRYGDQDAGRAARAARRSGRESARARSARAIPYDSYCVIIKVYEKTPFEKGTFEEARSGLEAMAQAMGENARQREMAGQMRKDYNVDINQAVVDMIVAKTAAVYPTPDGPPGQIPEFSEEEIGRDLARWKGGAWKVRTYVESINSVRDFMRPGHGVDKEIVKSLVGDFVTGELWQAEIPRRATTPGPRPILAGQRAAEEVMVTALHDELVKDVTVDDAEASRPSTTRTRPSW